MEPSLSCPESPISAFHPYSSWLGPHLNPVLCLRLAQGILLVPSTCEIFTLLPESGTLIRVLGYCACWDTALLVTFLNTAWHENAQKLGSVVKGIPVSQVYCGSINFYKLVPNPTLVLFLCNTCLELYSADLQMKFWSIIYWCVRDSLHFGHIY